MSGCNGEFSATKKSSSSISAQDNMFLLVLIKKRNKILKYIRNIGVRKIKCKIIKTLAVHNRNWRTVTH